MPKLSGDLLALFVVVIAAFGCSTALAALHVFSEPTTLGIFTTGLAAIAGFVKASSPGSGPPSPPTA